MSSSRIEDLNLSERTHEVMKAVLPAVKKSIDQLFLDEAEKQKKLDPIKYHKEIQDRIEQEAEKNAVKKYMDYVDGQIESLEKVEDTGYFKSFFVTTLGASPKKNCFTDIKQRLEVLDAMLKHTALSGHHVCEFEFIQKECAIIANYCRGFTFNSSSWQAYKKLYKSNDVLGIDKKDDESDGEKELTSFGAGGRATAAVSKSSSSLGGSGAAAGSSSSSLGGAATAAVGDSRNGLLSGSQEGETQPLQNQTILAPPVASHLTSSSPGAAAAASISTDSSSLGGAAEGSSPSPLLVAAAAASASLDSYDEGDDGLLMQSPLTPPASSRVAVVDESKSPLPAASTTKELQGSSVAQFRGALGSSVDP